MTKAGADIIVAHMGVTTGGAIGAETSPKSLDDCVAEINAHRRRGALACARTSSCICHGGPIAMPDDARLHSRRAARTATASTAPSSMERLPVEGGDRAAGARLQSLRCAAQAENDHEPSRTSFFVYRKRRRQVRLRLGPAVADGLVRPRSTAPRPSRAASIDLPSGQGQRPPQPSGRRKRSSSSSRRGRADGRGRTDAQAGWASKGQVAPAARSSCPESRFHSTLNTGERADAAVRRLFARGPRARPARPARFPHHPEGQVAQAGCSSGFDFLELDQRAVEVLGMKEQHRQAVRADLGLCRRRGRAHRPR